MISKEAKSRAKIISFWKKYGLEATIEAYGVKRRTLYLWQKEAQGGQWEARSAQLWLTVSERQVV